MALKHLEKEFPDEDIVFADFSSDDRTRKG
jgi:hypothetical protein